ncbi:MAG: DNA-binding transcriptional LysR family regulator [Oceanospirillaceae bacterium]|jgi:DNA-binding transcriptional LysR family regulator
MMKYLRHMMVFNAIVESGSISAAAEQLNISKSVLSQQLQTLEQVLNVELLKRTTRRQVLTPAGKQFFAQCQQISSIGEQAWRDAHNSQKLAIGRISISAPHALMDTLVAPAIGALISQHPKIIPHLHSLDTRVHLLDEDIDLAIRIGQSNDSEFKQQRIGLFADHLCVSKRYLNIQGLAAQQVQHNPELACSLDYIANSWQGSVISHPLRNDLEKKVLQFRSTRFANSINGVLALVKEGAGIGLIPQILLDKLSLQDLGDLVIITQHYTLNTAPIYALHAFSQAPPHVVQLCINAIKSKMAAHFKSAI